MAMVFIFVFMRKYEYNELLNPYMIAGIFYIIHTSVFEGELPVCKSHGNFSTQRCIVQYQCNVRMQAFAIGMVGQVF